MLGLSNPELGVLMLGCFVVFIMLGFPIAFTLMALGIGFGYLAMGDTVFQLVVQRTYSVMANDVLVSIPLFVFMGYIIERANILDRLFNAIQLAIGWMPGSLAIATLATCAIFANVTTLVPIVDVPVTLPDPLKLPLVQATSPVMAMVRPVVSVAALPVVFWLSVGISAATTARNVGVPDALLGAARNVLAACDPKSDAVTKSVPPRVREPDVVTVPVRVSPLTVPVPLTDVTVPLPPPLIGTQPVADRTYATSAISGAGTSPWIPS
jgi:hypothetical protein